MASFEKPNAYVVIDKNPRGNGNHYALIILHRNNNEDEYIKEIRKHVKVRELFIEKNYLRGNVRSLEICFENDLDPLRNLEAITTESGLIARIYQISNLTYRGGIKRNTVESFIDHMVEHNQ
jgi:hypothetical protein